MSALYFLPICIGLPTLIESDFSSIISTSCHAFECFNIHELFISCISPYPKQSRVGHAVQFLPMISDLLERLSNCKHFSYLLFLSQNASFGTAKRVKKI